MKDVDEMSPAERASYYADCIRGAAQDSKDLEVSARELATVLADVVEGGDIPACFVKRALGAIHRYNAIARLP